MKELIRTVASKVLGTVCGMITGIGAGFIPPFYLFLNGPGVDWPGVIFYFVSLPFSILWQMGKGAMEGAQNGFMAGLTYPKKINDWFLMFRHNFELYENLEQHLDASKPPTFLLTDEEEQEFQTLLKQEQISPERRAVLATDFSSYLEYVKNTKCVLTGSPLKNLEKPLEIRVNNQKLVCEAEAFRDLVDECKQKQIPVNFGKVNKPAAHDVITIENVFIYTINSIPKSIAKFILNAKKLFSSMHLINKTLGLTNAFSGDVVSVMNQSGVKNSVEKKPLRTRNEFLDKTPDISNDTNQKPGGLSEQNLLPSNDTSVEAQFSFRGK